ncbi:hypothetical protein BGX38DRAFT_1095775 [Terfezia claveryi]|nr:hypothetical protein BGX38DRAFT_1095775 [Terfezia claveryi]
MNHRHLITHPHQYRYYIPPGPPLPPIPPRDSFQEPRTQDYYGGHAGTGRYYHHSEKETSRAEKDVHRWSLPAVVAAEAAHASASRQNDSSTSGSGGHGHGKEKERKKIVERPGHERKGSRPVEKSSSVGQKGNPLRELEQLRFTPKVTAGTHMRRFEKLVGMAYPGVSSGGKWYVMFVKTLNYPGLWGANCKTTPGKWAIELNKTENMTFDHIKALFIERWGTRDEREQLRSSVEGKKEKDRERQEKDHQYLHQREIIVTISDDKRRRVKDRQRQRHGNSKGEGTREKIIERDQISTMSRSRTESKPCSPRIISLSPPPPSLAPVGNLEGNSTMGVASDHAAVSSPIAPIRTPTSTGGTASLRSRLLEGKVAAVTGASRGIGRAMSLGFAREGAHIVAHYWGTVSDPSNDDIVSLATEIRGMGQRCEVVFGDISDPDTSHKIVHKAVEEFGRLDIGVGNAGMCWFRDFWDITPELMRRHVDVNLNGNMWFVQACARQMKAQYVSATKTALDEDNWEGDGDFQDIPDHSLLLVSSTTSMTASPAAAHYAASSAGIVSLVQSMAVELGKYGIRCNAILPGTVMTRMVKEGVEDMDRRRGMERGVPLLGRLGRPRDVVGPAIFLAGEQSRYVTGARLAVDGGASAGGGGGW